MRFSSVLLKISLLCTSEALKWGPKVHLGPAKSEILGFRGILTPGYPPEPEATFTAIWPGLWDPYSIKYDLVQSVTSSHDRSYMTTFCGAKRGQW